MDTTPPFELEELRRDWIVGLGASAFHDQACRQIERIRECEPAARECGVMIAERGPVQITAAFFAAVYLQVPVVLANPRWGQSEWREVESQLTPALIFGEAYSGLFDRQRELVSLAPGSILIPTGGSTGGVRFAIHDWNSLTIAFEGLRSVMGPVALHACCVLPLFHVSGLMQVVRAFQSGGRVAFLDYKNLCAGVFPDFRGEPCCLSLVPTQLQRLMQTEPALLWLSACRAIFVGGAPASDAVIQRARELRLPLSLSYGMTETAAMVAMLGPVEFLSGQTNAGHPLPHARIEILDPGGGECATGVTGRIHVGGGSLFKGYLGQAPLDDSRGFLTDDEGFFDGFGCLHIQGRRDRLILSGGEKIDPKEVEAVIQKFGRVDQVLVLGWPDPDWGQKLIVFYVPGKSSENPSVWQEKLGSEIAPYKLPKVLIEVDDLPLTAHGKVDRERIVELLKD